MLNGRIYRAAFIPLLFALAIAGFSLTDRAAPLGSSLAPDAFEGARAFAELQRLAARFPARRPGSAGDDALAAEVAQTLRGLGGPAHGGFSVSTRTVRAPTIDGERTLTTVIAQRPGTTGEQPIVILAHRDAAGRGAAAELSGTAALLELARVLAAGETRRTIVLVSTSGGSGGNAGAEDFAAHARALLSDGMGAQIDAALVLGDLAGTSLRAPLVASLSSGPDAAPALLQSTLAAALSQQAGVAAGAPSAAAQLAHLVLPLTAGEQGPLNAHGLPAALLGVSGERAPPANEPVSAARLESFGRAALSAVYALDGGPEVASASGSSGSPSGFEAGLPIQRKAIPRWALRLLVAALLLPALLVLGDGVARLRRRGEPLRGATLWVLACALPFFACALFAILLGRLAAIAAPRPAVSPAALPFTGAAVEAAIAVGLMLVFAWLGWPALMRRLRLSLHADTDAATLAPLCVLAALAAVVWVFDPLTALLLLPALHLWLVFASPMRPPAARVPLAALGLLVLGVAPLALLGAFYATQLDLGAGGIAHTALLLLASGRIGVAGALLWSVAFGVLAAMLAASLALPPLEGPPPSGPEDGIGDREGGAAGRRPAGRNGDVSRRRASPVFGRAPLPKSEAITVRGGWERPKSYYAGPGSLGGTESALRR